MLIKRLLSMSLIGLTALTLALPPAEALADRDRRGSSTQRVLKKALIGAGVGAAIGGITAPSEARGRGIMKGALIGGAVGGGYGLLTERGAFRRQSNNGWGTNVWAPAMMAPGWNGGMMTPFQLRRWQRMQQYGYGYNGFNNGVVPGAWGQSLPVGVLPTYPAGSTYVLPAQPVYTPDPAYGYDPTWGQPNTNVPYDPNWYQ